jgi:hypothetical protein
MYRQRSTKQTASQEDELQVIVTHPFHPLKGKKLMLICKLHLNGKTLLRCIDAGGSSICIAAGYTDYAQDYGDSKYDLSYKSLLDLCEVVDSIKHMTS